MVDHRCFPGVPPVTDREPVVPNLGDRIDIHGTVLLVRGTSIAYDHRTVGPTAGVIDLAPVPPKPRTPEKGEVWRNRDHGSLYLIHGHDSLGYGAIDIGGSKVGGYAPGNRWSDMRTAPAKVFDGCFAHEFEFYAESPRAAFARLERES